MNPKTARLLLKKAEPNGGSGDIAPQTKSKLRLSVNAADEGGQAGREFC